MSGKTASLRASCAGRSVDTCRLKLQLTVVETFKGDRLVAITARSGAKKPRRVVFHVGSASYTLHGGQTKALHVSLNAIGKRLLGAHHPLPVKLQVIQQLASHHTKTVFSKTLTFKLPPKRHPKPHAAAFGYALRWS